MDELKPCPFCKTEEVSIIKDVDGIYIKCYKCWSSADKAAKDIKEAIKLWNKRA